MRLKLNFAITGEQLANNSMILIILIICFPLTMVLPSIIRMPLQILAILLFVFGLVLLRSYKSILVLFVLFTCSYLYYIGAWEEMMEGTTFLYNSLCCWLIAIYAGLCISGIINNNKKVFWLVVILTLLTAITTILGLLQYPLAVRELGRGSSYTGTDIKYIYRSRNIASWSQVYGMVFLQGPFAYYYKKTKNKVVLATIIVTEICILSSQLTFGILLSLVILALVITNIKSNKYYLIVCLAGLVAFLIILNREIILLWFINLSDKFGLEMLTPKLRDLYTLVVFKVATGDADARFDLYTKSLSGFSKFPMGLFWNRDVQAINYIGYHSEFFDLLGGLGLMGVFLVIFCYLLWIHRIKKVKDAYMRRFVAYMFLMFILIFFLNPVFYSPQIWVGAFALPALLVGESLFSQALRGK